MNKCTRSLPDDLQCDLKDGHRGACKGSEKRCLCYYAIADFDGVHHDPRCERGKQLAHGVSDERERGGEDAKTNK